MERTLTVRAPGEPVVEYEIRDGEQVVGRDPACDLCVASRYVSRRHFALDGQPDGTLLRDLGGSNPILLNGKRIDGPVKLQAGDLLRVADVAMEYREEIPAGTGTMVFSAVEMFGRSDAVEQLTRSIWGKQHLGPGGTLTIMFTDIENSTPLVASLGDAVAQHLIQMHNDVLRQEFTRFRGYEAKRIGDGFLALFASARDALHCAIEIQRALDRMAAGPAESGVRVRIGLHVGEVLWDGGDIFGTAVNYAARVSAVAGGAEIVVSSLMRELVGPAGEFAFQPEQEVELKGFGGTHRISRVGWAVG